MKKEKKGEKKREREKRGNRRRRGSAVHSDTTVAVSSFTVAVNCATSCHSLPYLCDRAYTGAFPVFLSNINTYTHTHTTHTYYTHTTRLSLCRFPLFISPFSPLLYTSLYSLPLISLSLRCTLVVYSVTGGDLFKPWSWHLLP